MVPHAMDDSPSLGIMYSLCPSPQSVIPICSLRNVCLDLVLGTVLRCLRPPRFSAICWPYGLVLRPYLFLWRCPLANACTAHIVVFDPDLGVLAKQCVCRMLCITGMFQGVSPPLHMVFLRGEYRSLPRVRPVLPQLVPGRVAHDKWPAPCALLPGLIFTWQCLYWPVVQARCESFDQRMTSYCRGCTYTKAIRMSFLALCEGHHASAVMAAHGDALLPSPRRRSHTTLRDSGYSGGFGAARGCGCSSFSIHF